MRRDLYFAELLFNVQRFVGRSAISKGMEASEGLPEGCFISQSMEGDFTALSAVTAPPEVLVRFAAEYAKMELTDYDETVFEIAADFLNMHNGLFLVNLSDSERSESKLLPPVMDPGGPPLLPLDVTHVLPVEFPFGMVHFILSERISEEVSD